MGRQRLRPAKQTHNGKTATGDRAPGAELRRRSRAITHRLERLDLPSTVDPRTRQLTARNSWRNRVLPTLLGAWWCHGVMSRAEAHGARAYCRAGRIVTPDVYRWTDQARRNGRRVGRRLRSARPAIQRPLP